MLIVAPKVCDCSLHHKYSIKWTPFAWIACRTARILWMYPVVSTDQQEVFRGYVGDRSSSQIFNTTDKNDPRRVDWAGAFDVLGKYVSLKIFTSDKNTFNCLMSCGFWKPWEETYSCSRSHLLLMLHFIIPTFFNVCSLDVFPVDWNCGFYLLLAT